MLKPAIGLSVVFGMLTAQAGPVTATGEVMEAAWLERLGVSAVLAVALLGMLGWLLKSFDRRIQALQQTLVEGAQAQERHSMVLTQSILALQLMLGNHDITVRGVHPGATDHSEAARIYRQWLSELQKLESEVSRLASS